MVAGSENGTVYGIDRKHGTQRWEFRIDRAEKRAFQQFSSAEIFKDKAFVGCADCFLYCLDLMSGTLNWKWNLNDWVRSKPLVYDGHVFAATLDGQLFKFTLDGQRVWIKRPSGGVVRGHCLWQGIHFSD